MAKRKGIILAGGAGTRLYPLTLTISKQLLPVFDKPMVYYPLCTLMLAEITQILIITTKEDAPLFRRLLGNGEQWGMQLSYAVQRRPAGIAEALIIAEPFLDGAPSALILGDNIFYGDGIRELLVKTNQLSTGATVLAYWVKDPERYGVVQFDANGVPVRVVEKPKDFVSNWAITGLYFFDAQAVTLAKRISPSARGELEITAVNEQYLNRKMLNVVRLGRGYAWLDAGTHEALLASSQFVHAIESRQGLKIACPEEIAFRNGFIDRGQLLFLAKQFEKTDYGAYLVRQAESDMA
ncbi:glucose-1-phosphate thymidylyltransferase RfbA [uncultured Bradyrhizobium sp.]|jgi:glucose-1-phosphate thymidylyltransferase|uniref:glucose-1-phosphate thymidylyltransferase RfbA n=1 Tax=uncultured Bradyrhizobium sp. TaxID=199684 RepID=UPI00261861DD|nr:glucose-1-phosphate thymidylyltransferase RfbA [uncultured Bradyrhizobium sp.]